MKTGEKIKVYLNGKIEKGEYKPYNERKLINVEFVKDKGARIVVKLPDGNIIERKKDRDLEEKII